MAQNLKNHIRFNPLHHFILAPLTIFILIGSILNLLKTEKESNTTSILLVLIAIALLLTTLIARLYALKNQDRIIRLEMRQRYYELTGKSFREREQQLHLSQIIALRFASNEELTLLIDKAIKEDLSSKSIKKEIKNWSPDYLRV